MSDLENPFWRFSLALYAEPGVAPLCLKLQDEAGLDVNLLLFALWRGMEGESLDVDRLRALDAAVSSWRDQVVRPLRAARRGLKPALDRLGPRRAAGEELRADLAAAELKAEQIEQALLHAETGTPCAAGGARLALSNLAQLMALTANSPRALDQRDIETLSAALASKL